jgi:polyphosphate kinase 2 (PPK2 family)
MLENVNLESKIAREDYERMLPGLQRRVYDLEKACWDLKIPSIVVFEGWDAAGKGGAIGTLTQRLDPRGFKLHSIHPPRTFEQNYPWLWRFWLKVPNRGEMVIFDESWFGRVLKERVERLIPESAVRPAFSDILDFERMLAGDGTIILKFFFHIGKKEQKRRFEKIEANPLESWRVGKKDWERHKKYDQYFAAAEEMLEITEADHAPWTIVEATSRWWARKKVLETIIGAFERRLGVNAPPLKTSLQAEAGDADLRAAMASFESSEGNS